MYKHYTAKRQSYSVEKKFSTFLEQIIEEKQMCSPNGLPYSFAHTQGVVALDRNYGMCRMKKRF